MDKSKPEPGQGPLAARAEVQRALVLKAVEIGGHVRNINDAAATVLHILQISLQVPGSSSRSPTVEQWSNIKESLREASIGIRKLSVKNEARINDALSRSFRRYLYSDNDPATKAAELEVDNLMMELLELGVLTQKSLGTYFETLEGVQEDISRFKRHWPEGEDTDYARKIRPSIIGIEDAIQKITNQEADLRDQNFRPASVAAVLTPITFLLPFIDTQVMRALIEGNVHARVQFFFDVWGSGCQTFNHLCLLIDVGHLLCADMEDLQAQYEGSYYHHKDFEGFRRRFNAIISLYASVEGALRAFNTACYMPGASTASNARGSKMTATPETYSLPESIALSRNGVRQIYRIVTEGSSAHTSGDEPNNTTQIDYEFDRDGDSDLHLSLVLTASTNWTEDDLPGPGRLLDKVLQHAGRKLEAFLAKGFGKVVRVN